MKKKNFLAFFFILLFLQLGVLSPVAPATASENANEEKILATVHSISSHELLEYVKEVASEKYGGRLTGTEAYEACARWVASLLEKWGLKPSGDGRSFFQAFPNPYTLVFAGCEAYLHLPVNGAVVKKYYRYDDEFIPGSTSGSGEVTAEVVYVGYGVTAPELGYDDYAGLDVRGKILLMDWKGVPSLSFSVSGAPSFYHNTKDTIETITPEILEDLARILFVAVLDMSDEPVLDFRK